MTDKELFLMRMDALVERLKETLRAVEAVKAINNYLYRRAAAEFQLRINDKLKEIQAQRSMIKDNFDSAEWRAQQDCEQNCSALFQECLAFLQAAHTRGQDVDAYLCVLADALLDELAKVTEITWNRFTVLASEEFFFDMAQIIRLRFPVCGIWDLPVSAHEFGHFVAGRLNRAKLDGIGHELPFQKYKEAFKQQHPEGGDKWMFYLEEFFADIFATYTLGPAYACTCLLLRFYPASAQHGLDNRHPPDSWRAQAILQTLRYMNMEQDSKGRSKLPVDQLEKFWTETLDSAGVVVDVSEYDTINGIVSSLYPDLCAAVPHARFNRWASALDMYSWLGRTPPSQTPPPDFNISDLLNAAWLCRLGPDTDPTQLSKTVIGLCQTAAR
ncbi:hypothetical protein [Methylovulum miyakonense]|uniref:hypothetical protein n=1 Tax=Methylovulum miyakonense TaxID=645578 RepID=UPI0003607195|nr:hypothetical protein [Methylovulum miyakonense]